MIEHERSFEAFGSRVRLLVGPAHDSDLSSLEIAAIEAEAFMRLMQRKLTRFDPDSELSALAADPREECPASPLLAMAARAAVWAAERTDGLVDPTLVAELERAGYATSRVGAASAPLAEAIEAAPARRPARPRADARWRKVSVDLRRGTVRRPPGVRLDTGGTGKGLAADLVFDRLRGYELCADDAGGDLRIGGARPAGRLVEIDHPLTGGLAHGFEVAAGAVATSGLKTRIWRTPEGFAHHLLDPSTGRPAWTGVIQATALADTALLAETIAKQALLSGPERGRELLAPRGGVLVLDDGTVDAIGPLAAAAAEPSPIEAAAA